MLQTIRVKDNNATWERYPDGDWYCTHDGNTHFEKVTNIYYDPRTEDSVDEDYTIEVCDSCGDEIDE